MISQKKKLLIIWKKKLFKIEFFLSVFLVCILSSYYIYAEYDKAKSEEGAKEILASTNIEKIENDDTTIKDELLVVVLDQIELEGQEETTTREIQDIAEREKEQNASWTIVIWESNSFNFLCCRSTNCWLYSIQ